MDIIEVVLAIAIAIIHPYFFHKLVDKTIGYDTASKMCDTDISHDEIGGEKWNQCNTAKKTILKGLDLKRHIILLVIALVTILLATTIRQKSTKLGFGIAGIILLIISVISYWENYTETAKLVTLGVSLVIVVYMSIKLYSVFSISDIFSSEFGTK
jgi:uncharacterized membrane protein